MNRRDANKTIAAGVAALATGQSLAQNAPQPVRIVEVSKLTELWSDAEFRFLNQPSLMVRVPVPKTASPRVLKVSDSVALTAYSRICTHSGCLVPLPDRQQNIECGCHGSQFKADGSLVAGPAPEALRAIRLEVREGAVFALGFLES